MEVQSFHESAKQMRKAAKQVRMRRTEVGAAVAAAAPDRGRAELELPLADDQGRAHVSTLVSYLFIHSPTVSNLFHTFSNFVGNFDLQQLPFRRL